MAAWANLPRSTGRSSELAAFRYDVVREAAEWVIATGGPTWRGHASKGAAVTTAVRAAKELEAKGYVVEVYVWDSQISTKVYESPPPR
jgi:hypothetical protein